MRPKTINESDIISFLSNESEIDGFSDDPDAYKTWKPLVLNTNTKEYEDEDEEEEYNGFEQVCNSDIIEDISKAPSNLLVYNLENIDTSVPTLLLQQPQTSLVVTTTSWAPVPFNGIQLPDQQYGNMILK